MNIDFIVGALVGALVYLVAFGIWDNFHIMKLCLEETNKEPADWGVTWKGRLVMIIPWHLRLAGLFWKGEGDEEVITFVKKDKDE